MPRARANAIGSLAPGRTRAESASGVASGLVPAFNFDFTASTLDPKFVFTRAGTANYYRSDGYLTAATTDQRRITYWWDGSAFSNAGTLMESVSTNICRYNSDPSDGTETLVSGYAVAACSYQSRRVLNDLIDVFGTQGSTDITVQNLIFTLTIDGTNAQHYFSYTPPTAPAASTNYNFSVYVLEDTQAKICLAMPASIFTTVRYAWFDLANPSATGIANATNGSPAATSIEKLGSGGNGKNWYRISISATSNGAPVTGAYQIFFANDTTTAPPSYTGDGTTKLRFVCPQIEARLHASSWIHAPGNADVTRAYDSLTATNAQNWMIPGECSWVCENIVHRATASAVLNMFYGSFAGASACERDVHATAQIGGSTAKPTVYNFEGGSTSVNQTSVHGATANRSVMKTAVRWATNNTRSYSSGAGSTDAGCNIIPLTSGSFYIAYRGSVEDSYVTIRSLKIYSEVLSDAQILEVLGE